MDLLISILIIVLTSYLILKFASFFKTVPIEYLNQQSYIEPTRLNNESSIYRSIKSPRLTVGLDIRYDHYKLRNGNLNDIWMIVLQNLEKKTGQRGIYMNDEFIEFEEINHNILHLFDDVKPDSINISCDFKIDKKWTVIVLTAFINQIPINFYDSKFTKPKNGMIIDDLTIIGGLKSLDTNYKYTPEKDKGTAFKIQDVLNKNIYTNIEFTQLNLISAIASTIKHLPSNKVDQFKSIEIISSTNSYGTYIKNIVLKLLFGLVQNYEIHINDHPTFKYDITSISEPDMLKYSSKLNIFQKLRYILLTNGFFDSKKLIYLESDSMKSVITSNQQNAYKIKFNSNIITEYLIPEVIGPLVVTDYYEYRTFGPKFGSLPQCLEMKIYNLDKSNKGRLMIRGYSIGKSERIINDSIEESSRRNDGFKPLTLREPVKWGNDGCLYFDCK
ncbi:hypothetical protein KGF54_000757 [Candida jiufengensis]|uniref:uncharacterized protein n=1 Tax=Candida jiufengensis TaxID=497108 RepID=UPI0022258984|nr:uncharacterized protein KGF54_000757 [Candida jiufengensis]KAI5956282.1 hypothetical protein KGF54_000757 [Candida jiufengensis]